MNTYEVKISLVVEADHECEALSRACGQALNGEYGRPHVNIEKLEEE